MSYISVSLRLLSDLGVSAVSNFGATKLTAETQTTERTRKGFQRGDTTGLRLADNSCPLLTAHRSLLLSPVFRRHERLAVVDQHDASNRQLAAHGDRFGHRDANAAMTLWSVWD